MKSILTTILFLFFLAAPVLAQSSTNETADETESDSRINRDESIIFVGVSPFGLHLPTLISQPLSVGVYLGPNFLIALETGSRDFELEGDKKDTLEGTYGNQGVYARWFPGSNSFNVLLGIHQRTLDATYTYPVKIEALNKTVDLVSTATYDAQVATVGIGNQWLMDFGLVIGFDWLVASSILSSTFEFKPPTLPGGAQPDAKTQAKIDDAEAEAQLIADGASSFPGLLVLTVGFSF